MKTKTIGLTLMLSLATGAICFANPNLGTWKLNEGKSKFGEGVPKGETVVWATVGDQVKVTVDGTSADGKKMHTEWTGKLDGKDYPLTGDSMADTRSFKTSEIRRRSRARRTAKSLAPPPLSWRQTARAARSPSI